MHIKSPSIGRDYGRVTPAIPYGFPKRVHRTSAFDTVMNATRHTLRGLRLVTEKTPGEASGDERQQQRQHHPVRTVSTRKTSPSVSQGETHRRDFFLTE